MEIRAYDEVYLTQAQRILGDMMDFAVNSCDMDPDEYFRLFLVSPISTQFENGNPAYVSGKTGCEIVKERLRIQRGMSQRELSVSSGVPLRQIQLFEQRQRDINKTQAGNLFALSRILCCKMEELLEK